MDFLQEHWESFLAGFSFEWPPSAGAVMAIVGTALLWFAAADQAEFAIRRLARERAEEQVKARESANADAVAGTADEDGGSDASVTGKEDDAETEPHSVRVLFDALTQLLRRNFSEEEREIRGWLLLFLGAWLAFAAAVYEVDTSLSWVIIVATVGVSTLAALQSPPTDLSVKGTTEAGSATEEPEPAAGSIPGAATPATRADGAEDGS